MYRPLLEHCELAMLLTFFEVHVVVGIETQQMHLPRVHPHLLAAPRRPAVRVEGHGRRQHAVLGVQQAFQTRHFGVWLLLGFRVGFVRHFVR